MTGVSPKLCPDFSVSLVSFVSLEDGLGMADGFVMNNCSPLGLHVGIGWGNDRRRRRNRHTRPIGLIEPYPPNSAVHFAHRLVKSGEQEFGVGLLEHQRGS